MGIFSSILDKIFHHSSTTTPAAPASAPGPTQQSTQPSTPPVASAPTQRLQSVDVEAVLTKLASAKGGGGNWQTSIVDLLKLLDLDSSLAARKELVCRSADSCTKSFELGND